MIVQTPPAACRSESSPSPSRGCANGDSREPRRVGRLDAFRVLLALAGRAERAQGRHEARILSGRGAALCHPPYRLGLSSMDEIKSSYSAGFSLDRRSPNPEGMSERSVEGTRKERTTVPSIGTCFPSGRYRVALRISPIFGMRIVHTKRPERERSCVKPEVFDKVVLKSTTKRFLLRGALLLIATDSSWRPPLPEHIPCRLVQQLTPIRK